MDYEVRVTKHNGDMRTIACEGRDAPELASRHSQRRTVNHAEIWHHGVWMCTYVNGRRGFGIGDGPGDAAR